MKHNRIFISAANQHTGKTTTTLGLVNAIASKGFNVGYCKPVGQQSVIVKNGHVDKDTVLFSDSMGFDIDPDIHSPVLLGQGTVQDILDHPENYHLPARINKAAKVLGSRHDVVVFEGTGHPGVGSVAGVSNADVAKMLGAGVIMIVEGGIGSTLDRLHLCLNLFHQKRVPILGVIVNKTLIQKKEKVSYYVNKKLTELGIPLLGVIPFEEELAYPLMRTVVQALNGKVMHHEDKLDNRVQDILAGSLIDRDNLRSASNLLLVVSASRLDDALHRLQAVARKMGGVEACLSGIIATGKGEVSATSLEYINKYEVPVVYSQLDTYESAMKISKIEVKINSHTPWKIAKAIELFKDHVNIDEIIANIRAQIA